MTWRGDKINLILDIWGVLSTRRILYLALYLLFSSQIGLLNVDNWSTRMGWGGGKGGAEAVYLSESCSVH